MPKFHFPKGTGVGIIYVQVRNNNYYTGVHNGAMLKYSSSKKAYLINHSGSATLQPSGNYKFNIKTLNFYEAMEAYRHSKQTSNDYLLIDMDETRPELSNLTNHPSIAFVRASDGKVHNGKFSAFVPSGSTTKITHYNEIKKKIKSGHLDYWHYNLESVGSGRVRIFQEKISGVSVLDMTKLISS